MRIAILEGVTGAGKTTLFNKIRKQAALRSLDCALFYSQRYTQRMFEESPLDDANQQGWDFQLRLVNQLCNLNDIWSSSSLKSKDTEPVALLETFHFTRYVADLSSRAWDNFMQINTCLKQLNPTVFLSVLSSTSIQSRCVDGPKCYRNVKWKVYHDEMSKLYPSLAAVYERRQETMQSLLRSSSLNGIEVSTESEEWNSIATVVAREWLGE